MAEKFRPVQGSEHDIKNSSPVEGYLYFATDTKKIFLAKEGNYLPMGGNSGIYYGNRIITEEEEILELTSFIFTPEDIEGDQTPNVNDLILNIPDGCFYRVMDVSEDGIEITGERLTIAGSGGGGAGGGGGSGTGTSIPVVNDPLKGEDQYFVTNQGEMNIEFYCSSQSLEGNRIETIEYYIGTNKIYTDNKGYEFNETITFDISPYVSLLNTGTKNTLAIKAIDIYGNESRRKNFYFYLVNLQLTSDFDTIYKMVDTKSFSYPCKPLGGAGLTNRYIKATLALVDTPNSVVIEKTFEVKNTNVNLQLPIDFEEQHSHGVYILKTSFCALLPNGEEVKSAELTHQIVYYISGNSSLIAGYVPSNTVTQYDTITITYMIVDEQATTTTSKVCLYTEGKGVETDANMGVENYWSKTFNETGIYNLEIEYNLTRKNIAKIEVLPYAGNLPTIDDTNLELYLTAQERSNTESQKDFWAYKDIEGKFENFLWGTANGWLKDDDGQTALKLTNGAKFSLPTYHPFAIDGTKQGLTIELDVMFSGVLDYSKPLIQCLSINDSGVIATGFHVTGQKATLNSSINKATTTVLDGEEDASGNINETDMALQAFTQYYNENERLHITYVVERVPENFNNIPDNAFYFVYTYLNGVMSGIMRLKVDKENQSKETFLDANGSPSYIEFDSTYGDIYIYNLRVYRGALDSRTIINNYIADLTNIDEKIELYKINNIFDDAGLISLNAIQDISYQLKVPYVLLKGGSKMPKKFKDSIVYTEAPTYALPLTKSDYRLMSMQMFDRLKDNEKPVFEVPIELEDSSGNKITDFKDIQSGINYKMNRGVQVYGQGTSSMVYPVKNLRLKFRKEEDYPVVYDGAYPVEIACFKADFMDSSASHNTGTANLVYDLLSLMNLRSPAQQFKYDHNGEDGVATHDLLTAIRGFPIVCFYADGNSDNYTYIGRYNFNIDKATPEPFGFFPQKVYTGKTTTDEQGRERKEVEVVGLKTEKVNNMNVLPLDSEGKEIERDIIQCWEMLNNDTGSPVKFLTLEDFRQYGLEGFKKSLTTVNAKGDKFGWMDYYEDRYPDAMVSGGAFALGDKEEDEYKNLDEDLENGIFRLACWINSTATDEVTNNTIEPVYYQTRDSVYNPEKDYYINQDGVYNKKEIIISKVATIKKGEVLDENYPNKLGPSIDVNVFAEKVNNVYNQYNFIYIDEEGSNKGWYIGTTFIGENLENYGITYTGNPINTNVLIVEFNETNDWAPTLFEQFSQDNEEYRLSKFKAEFQDYMNLNFALFYYVLTMLLLMMDSRAKNMMLASWDQTIWYPIFYDMDTALGVNNTGFNKFAYDTEDDPRDRVFNGYDSVLWNNFRECFYSEICSFYAKMRQHLTIGKLLTTYNANASDKWNEALTTADAEYKYIRPYEEGYYDGKNTDDDGNPVKIEPGKVSYLYAGQGKRTNHRSYWLNNRAKYFDSKYIPLTLDPKSGITVDAFNFRAYSLPEQQSSSKTDECIAQVPASHKFDITALNNSYQSIYIGNILYGPIYTLANQTVTLGPNQVKHEVESYILNPDLISNLGDLSNKYLGQFNFPSGKTRLTELNFGRSSHSHKPGEYEKYYNKLLSALNVGDSCPYLQKINIARCTGLKSVDFTKCPRLRELDAEGTLLTDISFPANSILETVYLPNTLTSLILTNQPYLSSIVFDDLSVGTRAIDTVVLDRVSAMDTYPIVKNIFANQSISEKGSKTYYLTEVNWTVNETDDVILEDGKIAAITILEKLLQANCRGDYAHSQSLSGTLTVAVEGTAVNQFSIYEKYNKLFPNLTIKYDTTKVTVEGAKIVRFYSDDVVENARIIYEVFTDGKKDLGYLTSASGPNGAALGTPKKDDTNEYSYVFTGRWKTGDTIYTTVESEITNGDYPSLYLLIPTEELTEFYPIYNTTSRLYPIKFYNYDGSLFIDQELPWHYSYSVPNFLNRDSSELDLYKRWTFKGWTLEKNPIKPNYIDTSNLIVTGALTAYAQFEEEDVRKNASKMEYFTFDYNYSCTIDGKTYFGSKINISDTYRYYLSGKVTLPLKDDKGNDIISMGNFEGATGITHFFWLEGDSKYVEIGEVMDHLEQSLGLNTMLEAVYIPNSIIKIEDAAFRNCKRLKTIPWHNNSIVEIGDFAFWNNNGNTPLEMNELPLSLKRIGSNSFFGAANENFIVTKIPEQLTSIGSYAFWYGPNVTITDFNGSLAEIGEMAFSYAGKNIKTDSIVIRENVIKIYKNAFGRASNIYGHGKIKFVGFENPYTVYLDALGLSSDPDADNPELMEPKVVSAMGFNIGDELFNWAFNYDDNTK